MATILVPTDFSDASKNAINYAVEFSKILNAKIILFHAFHVPTAVSEAPMNLPSLDEIEKDCLENLKTVADTINLTHKNSIKIECKSACGFAVEEINSIASEENADFIIMGMQGAGFLIEKLIGSTTTSIIKKTNIPVLVIEKEAVFKPIKNIVFASDFKTIKNDAIFNPLQNIIKHYNSHLHILNVVEKNETLVSISQANEGLKLNHRFENINHSFHTIENDNIVEGINEFAGKKNADLIVMIPRTHNLLWNIFNKPTTTRMAFNSNTPLLTLHE